MWLENLEGADYLVGSSIDECRTQTGRKEVYGLDSTGFLWLRVANSSEERNKTSGFRRSREQVFGSENGLFL